MDNMDIHLDFLHIDTAHKCLDIKYSWLFAYLPQILNINSLTPESYPNENASA